MFKMKKEYLNDKDELIRYIVFIEKNNMNNLKVSDFPKNNDLYDKLYGFILLELIFLLLSMIIFNNILLTIVLGSILYIFKEYTFFNLHKKMKREAFIRITDIVQDYFPTFKNGLTTVIYDINESTLYRLNIDKYKMIDKLYTENLERQKEKYLNLKDFL